MAISVVVAVGGVGDALVKKIEERIPSVVVGPGTDPKAEMGPLITKEHRDKVVSYIGSARAQGATVKVDGSSYMPPAGNESGFFCGITLVDDVKPGMDVYDNEVFGPVLSVVRVDTYDDGLKLINDNQYGNGTAIFTRDGGLAREFQQNCLVGMVGINVPIPVPVAYYSFGGWKASLFGDRHMYGPEGVDFFTRTKAVTSRWPDPRESSVNLGFPENR